MDQPKWHHLCAMSYMTISAAGGVSIMSLEAFTHYALSIRCIRETEADLIQSTRATNCESSLGCLEIVTLDQ